VADVDLSRQFHYWPNGDSWDAWSVHRLLEHAAGRPAEAVRIDDLTELDTNYWFHAGHEPTVRNVVRHVLHATRDVDPSYAVLLGPGDRVLDGMHRIVRAMLAGETHVEAVRLPTLPPPDLAHCRLGETP
jgi:hypothetical protein